MRTCAAGSGGNSTLQRVDTALLLLVHRLLLLLLSCLLHWRQVLLRLSWCSRCHHTAVTGTEHHLRALGAGLWGESTIRRSAATLSAVLPTKRARLRHRLYCSAHRSGHSDGIWVVVGTALDPIAKRQEGIEALDELGVTCEQGADPTDDARGINCAALEVLHYVQEAVVHVRMVCKLHLDLVEVAQRVIQDRLLSLPLALRLTLAGGHVLLLLGSRLCSGCAEIIWRKQV